MKFATKKKAVAKKEAASTGTRGRAHSCIGKTLHKVNGDGLRESSRRGQTYKAIKEGMKFEKFRDGGGNLQDLSLLISNGQVKAK